MIQDKDLSNFSGVDPSRAHFIHSTLSSNEKSFQLNRSSFLENDRPNKNRTQSALFELKDHNEL